MRSPESGYTPRVATTECTTTRMPCSEGYPVRLGLNVIAIYLFANQRRVPPLSFEDILKDLRFDRDFFDLLTGSFQRLVNRPLVTADMTPHTLFYETPFAVLAHDGGADPRFIYANQSALDCFGYRLDELIGLPSRLSAEAPERAERQRLLDAVARDGFIPDYRGIRITKSGQRFWIENAIVWQLIGEDGQLHGQAATFANWREVSGLTSGV